jgi:hypothetical protein
VSDKPFVILKDPSTLTKRETEERVRIMGDFLDHPGWKIFAWQMEQVIAFETGQVMKASDADSRAIAVGRLRATQAMHDWPVRVSIDCQEALKRDAIDPGEGGFAPDEPSKDSEG